MNSNYMMQLQRLIFLLGKQPRAAHFSRDNHSELACSVLDVFDLNCRCNTSCDVITCNSLLTVTNDFQNKMQLKTSSTL